MKQQIHISAYHSKLAKRSMLQLPPTPTLPIFTLTTLLSIPALATAAASYTFLAPATPPVSTSFTMPKPSYAAIAGQCAILTPFSSTSSTMSTLSYAAVAGICTSLKILKIAKATFSALLTPSTTEIAKHVSPTSISMLQAIFSTPLVSLTIPIPLTTPKIVKLTVMLKLATYITIDDLF